MINTRAKLLKKIFVKTLPLLVGLACLGPLLLAPKTANASNPSTLNFQGKVVNSNGTNVSDGTYSFIFRIYNTASPTMTTSCTSTSSCLWQETQSTVSVTNGVFQVELGSACALTSGSCNNTAGGPINFATSNSLYLTMQFNGDTSGANGGYMSPLIHITSVPFALQADNSSTLGGLAAANFVQLAQGLQTDGSTTNASIAINKTGSTANILTLQKAGSNVLLLDNGGLLTLQPASSNLAGGQTHISENFTNADSSGSTVNGFKQTITVSNTSSASTTNGFNISLTDNASALANINTGIKISLSGSNANQIQTGADISVTKGIGLNVVSTGNGSQTCGLMSGVSVGVCSSGASTGVGGNTTGTSNALGNPNGTGTYGVNTASSPGAGNYVFGVQGFALPSGTDSAYTSIGSFGTAKGSASATVYAGYFGISSSSAATAGAALYATNSTVATNIFQLQDNTTSVFTVGDGGLITLQPAANLTAGQTEVTQTLTNASSTGGTVNGYSQTITVNNTSSASTTNGINISLTDSTSLGNTNVGIKIALQGTNTNQLQVGEDISVNHGIGIRVVSSGQSAGEICAGGVTSIYSVALCADSTTTGVTSGSGVVGSSKSNDGGSLGGSTGIGGAGVVGTNVGTGASSGVNYSGVKGIASQTGSAGYTSIGVYGEAQGGAGAKTYGGYFALNSSSTASAGAALYATNSTVAANILDLQDNTTSVFTVGDGGLITLQPAANLTAGQTEVAQTLTNASSTGGTVNGYSQTITVNNTSSASTTNGFNIAITDNASTLSNLDVGILINLAGSNSSRKQIGVDATASKGIGLRGISSAISGQSLTCADTTANISIGVCGDSTDTVNGGIGVYGRSSTYQTNSIGAFNGTGVYGTNTGNTVSNSFVKGLTGVTTGSGTAGTAVGVYGQGNQGAGATIYGGYFSLGTGGATAGAALYATNSTVGANILDLQDNTTSVFTVGDGGLITLQPAANLTAGQTEVAQTLTNASSTGGTVNGYSQTITVNNTSSASTTNGFNISLTDNTALANTNTGLKISLGGSNNYQGYGIDVSVSKGIGVRGIGGSFNANTVCADTTGIGAGVCGDSTPGGATATAGVYGRVSSDTSTLTNHFGAGVVGVSTDSGQVNSFTAGVKGFAATTSNVSTTTIGVYGNASAGGASATTYGGYFSLNSGSSTVLGSALYATNSTVAANILDLQDNTTSVFTVGDGGLITLQPAANLTAGQTEVAQTLTNASSTGGTVNGYSQTITVNNTSSASTTNGFNILLTDNTALANTNVGSLITLQGSNASQKQIGQDISVNHGTGLRITSSGTGGNVTCGGTSGTFGICVQATGGSSSVGIWSETNGVGGGVGASAGSGVFGFNSATGAAGNFYTGISGLAGQQNGAAYTSVGVFGKGDGGAGATTYGGYFKLGTSGATAGAALYATNSTVAANILDLQDNTTSVFTVGDGGVTVAKSNSATGFQVQDSSSSKEILTVDTSGDQVVLGKSGASGLDGKLTLKNATSTGTATITLAGNPSTNYTYQLPTGTVSSNQCLQSGTVSGGNVPLTFAACSAGGGDSGFVNSVAVTDFNLQDVASSSSVTGTTWTGTGSSPTNVTLAISNADATHTGAITAGTQTIGGVKTFQDFVILQPAANMTAGQTALTQTITNASSTGGTVNGYSQTITVSNTSSASTTNGFNISLTDNTALGNTNQGINITLAGSGSSQIQYGINIDAGKGYGIHSFVNGTNSNMNCGTTVAVSVSVCAENFTAGTGEVEGVHGETQANGTAGKTYTGLAGLASESTAAAYTSRGVYGLGKGGAGATVYGGYFALNASSAATAGAALYATNSTVGANVLDLQDNSTSVFTVGDGGLITLQPAANLTAGQTEVAQTLTNGSSGGGTVNGYSQTITVNNTGSASATNGFNITITDNASVGNSNDGIKITLNGSNSNQTQIGVEANVNAGIGIRGKSTGVSGTTSCGNLVGSNSIGVCGDSTTTTTSSVGVYGRANGNGGSIGGISNTGVIGYNDSIGTASDFYAGVRGFSVQSNAAAYTSIGTYGEANGGAGATVYGGYFRYGSNGASAGAALYATNTSSTAKILDLQDNTTSVFTVADGGLITLQPAANLTAGQTEVAQTLTNASSTGGTVNGYSQTISVAPTSSASTTNGFNISLTDNTALSNTNTGISVSLSGNNGSQRQYGVDSTVNHGVAIRGTTSGSFGTESCGGTVYGMAIGVCGGSSAASGVGVLGTNIVGGTAINTAAGSGVAGEINTGAAGVAGKFYKGVEGYSALTNAAAYTTVAVVGTAGGGAGATAYGGYFALTPLGATAGAALYASNSTVAGNILQLQDNTTDVLTVADGGATTLQNNSNQANAFQIKNAGGIQELNVDNTGSNQNNLVTNQSIESSANIGTAGDWQKRSGSETTFAQDSTQFYNGLNSLKVTTSAAAGDGAKQSGLNSGSNLTNGTIYTLNFYAKLDSASATFASGQGLQAGYAYNGSDITTLVSQTFTPLSSGWTRFSWTFKQNQTNSSTPYLFIKQTDANVHTFYIDGVTLQTDANADSNYREGKVTTNAIITSPVTLQNASNSVNAFSVQNASGESVINTDTTTANLVNNPGFEVNQQNWAADGSSTIVRDTSQAQTGTAALKVTTTTAAGDGAKYAPGTAWITKNTQYTIVLYAKASGSNFSTLQIGYRLSSGDSENSILTTQTVVTGGWTRYSATFTTNNTFTSDTTAYIYAKNTASSDARTFWIDGVRLEQASGISSYGGGNITLNGTIKSPVYLQNYSDSTTAFMLQNSAGTALLTGDTLNGQVLLGQSSALSGVLVFNNSAGTHTVSLAAQSTDPTSSITFKLPNALPGASNYCVVSSNLGVLSFLPCGASSTASTSLVPEFAGAVMTPDGTANSGTMTSDFCGNDGAGSFTDLNTGVCNTSGDFHNYYNWTSNGANDYDIFLRWRVPSDFSSFSTVQFNSKKSASGDDVKLTIYTNSGAVCGTGTSMTNTASAWQTTTYTISGCSPSPGDTLILDVHMAVAANGNTVQMGEIPITYNRN
jgi:hypothetical protein